MAEINPIPMSKLTVEQLQLIEQPAQQHRGSIQIFVPYGAAPTTSIKPVETRSVQSIIAANPLEEIRSAVWGETGTVNSYLPITPAPIPKVGAVPSYTTTTVNPAVMNTTSIVSQPPPQVITAYVKPVQRIVLANPPPIQTTTTYIQPLHIAAQTFARNGSQQTISRIIHDENNVAPSPDYSNKIRELQKMVNQLESEQSELRQNLSFGQGLIAGLSYESRTANQTAVVATPEANANYNLISNQQLINQTSTTTTNNTNITNTTANVSHNVQVHNQQIISTLKRDSQFNQHNRQHIQEQGEYSAFRGIQQQQQQHNQINYQEQIYILSTQVEEYRLKYEEVNIQLREYKYKYEEASTQLEEYRVQYEAVVKNLHDREDQSSKLRELAEAYEELEASHKNLQRLLEETDTKLNQANLKIAVYENSKSQDSDLRERIEQLQHELEQNKAMNEELYMNLEKVREDADNAAQDRQEMRRYVEEEQKRIFEYQKYTESMVEEYKQLAEELERTKADRETLIAKLNTQYQDPMVSMGNHVNEERVAMMMRNKEVELERMASMLRIKETEIDQLSIKIQRLENAQMSYNIPPEVQMKLSNYEKRIEVMTSEIERYNNTLLSKNREICELKGLTFEVDKLTKINMDLKNTIYESEKLNEVVQQRNSELATAKSTIQALERKVTQFEVVYKELEAVRQASLEVESLRDTVHKKDLEMTRLKQTIAVKESQVNDSLSQREQLRKKINALEAQLEDLRDELRKKATQTSYNGSELERSIKRSEQELRDTIKSLEADKLSLRNADRDKSEKMKILEAQVQELSKTIEKERTEYFNMRKNYEDKLFAADSAKKEAEGREKHHIYDLDLRKSEILRLEDQIKKLNLEYTSARNQLVANAKQSGDLKLTIQKLQSDIDMQRMETEQARKKQAAEVEAYEAALRRLEQRVQAFDSQHEKARSIIREAKDDAENLRHHLDQAGLRNKELEERNRILLVHEQQVVSYQESHRRAEATINEQRVYIERVAEEITQIQQELANKDQAFAEERQKLTEEIERLKESIITLQSQLEKTRSHGKPSFSSINGGAEVPKTQASTNNVRRENEILRVQLEEAMEKIQYYEQLVDSANELQNRVYQFQMRLQGLLNEEPSSSASRPSGKSNDGQNYAMKNLEGIITELNGRVRKFRGENEQLRRNLQEVSKRQQQMHNRIPEGFKKHYDDLIEENDELRGQIEQYESRIKEYQKEYIKLSDIHKQLVQEYSSINAAELRKNMQNLEAKYDFYRNQNTQLEERVAQLIRVNAELTAEVQFNNSKENNQKGAQYLKEELSIAQNNLNTVQERLRVTLEELTTVKREQLGKANSTNAGLHKKISSFQNNLYELESKLNVAASEKEYLESQKKQFEAKVEQLTAEVKKHRTEEAQAREKVTALEYQLKTIEEQKVQLFNKVTLLTTEVTRLRELNEQLTLDSTTYSNQKNALEQELEQARQQVASLNSEVTKLKLEITNNELALSQVKTFKQHLLLLQTTIQTDNLLYYVERAEAAVKELEETLPELRNPQTQQQISYSMSTSIGKAVGIFREIEHSKRSIRETRKLSSSSGDRQQLSGSSNLNSYNLNGGYTSGSASYSTNVYNSNTLGYTSYSGYSSSDNYESGSRRTEYY